MSLRRYTRSVPFNYTTYGVYRFGAMTGILAAGLAANSEIFQFRWDPVDTSLLAVIQRIRVSAAVSTTMFAAGVPCQLDLKKATAWTAVGTGGTGITPASQFQLKTAMADTALVANDMRIATTAALGAGTKTLETNNLGSIVAGGPITGSLAGTIFPVTDLFDARVSDGEHPIVLADQEGVVIRATVPGTGTWSAAIEIEWAETNSYPFGSSS